MALCPVGRLSCLEEPVPGVRLRLGRGDEFHPMAHSVVPDYQTNARHGGLAAKTTDD